MASTEKATQKAIQEYLTLKRIFHWRVNSGALRTDSGGFYKFSSINGVSDIIALHGGKAYFIEVKDVKGRQNEAQKEFQANVEKAGSTYLIAKSIDDVMDIL